MHTNATLYRYYPAALNSLVYDVSSPWTVSLMDTDEGAALLSEKLGAVSGEFDNATLASDLVENAMGGSAAVYVVESDRTLGYLLVRVNGDPDSPEFQHVLRAWAIPA